MRFNNKGQAKKNGDTDYVHQPGPPSIDIPGFIVAMNAGGKAPFFEDLFPEPPGEDDWPDDGPILE